MVLVWNRLAEAVLTSTHNLCFEQKYEKSQFLSENFQFLEVKFSINLNRRVFVICMIREQRSGGYFLHAQDYLNRHILRMFEGTFSLDAARHYENKPIQIY